MKYAKKESTQYEVPSSRTLWNVSIAPGWNRQEVEILKVSLMRHGIGSWSQIVESDCLPTKNISQMQIQTCRFLGQQSLAEFKGLHLDIDGITERNQIRINNVKNVKDHPDAKIFKVNGGLLVNIADNPTAKEIERKRQQNIKRFGLSYEYYMSLRPPKAKTKEWLKVLTVDQIINDKTRFSTSQKIHQLEILKIACYKKLKAIKRLEKYKATNMGLIFHKVDHSIHARDREYIYEQEVEVIYAKQKKQKEYEENLLKERARKQMEIREQVAKETLYQDQEEDDHYLRVASQSNHDRSTDVTMKTKSRTGSRDGLNIIEEELNEDFDY